MFAIAFDMVVADIRKHHHKGISAAYAEIGKTLARFEFEWVQGSVYFTRNSDMSNLFAAMLALRSLPWFPKCTRNVRGFRAENWSNFTKIVKGDKG